MNRHKWERQVFASNMNTTARLISLVVGSFGNWTEDREVWPSVTAIADQAGVNRDTASKYVEALVAQGWLRHIRTLQSNVKVYELQEVVADAVGILARAKRTLTEGQLSNLSTTGCRNEQVRLPKRHGLVADGIDTNIKEPTTRNIKEPTTTSPVADAPVDTTNFEIKEDEEDVEIIWDIEDSLNSKEQDSAVPNKNPQSGDGRFDKAASVYRSEQELAERRKRVLAQ